MDVKKYRGIILGAIVIIGIVLIVLSQQGKVVQIRRAVVGLDAPDFMVLDKNGTEITLAQHAGKTVFVHYWASWCKECKEELPGIQALYDRKKSDPGFVFLSVIYREDPIETSKYLRENSYTIPIYIDPGEVAARTYGVTGVPETFVINPEGILKNRVIGPGRWEMF